MASEAGKGSAPRKVRDDKAYNDGWDRIFGQKKKKGTEVPPSEKGSSVNHSDR